MEQYKTCANFRDDALQKIDSYTMIYIYIYIQPDKFAIFESPFHWHFVAMKKGHTPNIAHILYCDILFLLTFISVSAHPSVYCSGT